jgi:hypothetical protein
MHFVRKEVGVELRVENGEWRMESGELKIQGYNIS